MLGCIAWAVGRGVSYIANREDTGCLDGLGNSGTLAWTTIGADLAGFSAAITGGSLTGAGLLLLLLLVVVGGGGGGGEGTAAAEVGDTDVDCSGGVSLAC